MVSEICEEKGSCKTTKKLKALGTHRLWLAKLNTANWGFFLAVAADVSLGAAFAWKTNGVDMLEGRHDMSVSCSPMQPTGCASVAVR